MNVFVRLGHDRVDHRPHERTSARQFHDASRQRFAPAPQQQRRREHKQSARRPGLQKRRRQTKAQRSRYNFVTARTPHGTLPHEAPAIRARPLRRHGAAAEAAAERDRCTAPSTAPLPGSTLHHLLSRFTVGLHTRRPGAFLPVSSNGQRHSVHVSGRDQSIGRVRARAIDLITSKHQLARTGWAAFPHIISSIDPSGALRGCEGLLLRPGRPPSRRVAVDLAFAPTIRSTQHGAALSLAGAGGRRRSSACRPASVADTATTRVAPAPGSPRRHPVRNGSVSRATGRPVSASPSRSATPRRRPGAAGVRHRWNRVHGQFQRSRSPRSVYLFGSIGTTIATTIRAKRHNGRRRRRRGV